MKNKLLYLIYFFTFCSLSLNAQDWDDNEEVEKDYPIFFAGINAGALFPNNNTALIYTGASNVTNYGINYILSVPSYKLQFDDYFKHSYGLEETPKDPVYNTAFNIGLHAGVSVSKFSSIYVDINFANLKYEQNFTIVIDDPLNQSIDPTYEQFPIIGEEKRININLGTQLNYYNQDETILYLALFGNFNSLQLERNYIVINNKEYEIIHNTPQQPNAKPGGIGYGAGSGLGVKYKLSHNILADLTYNLYYIKTNMNDNIQGFGLNHGITFRLIWS